jgi:hypothetical protein
MRTGIVVLCLLSFLTFANPQLASKKAVVAEGVVVATPVSTDGFKATEGPGSLGDAVTLYLVRVDRWLPAGAQRPHFIVIEYLERGSQGHDGHFLHGVWRFSIQGPSAEETRDCASWIDHHPSFAETAVGTKLKVPDPKTIPCFVMKKPPIEINP